MARLDDLERLGSARVARLATVRPDGTPHLVPITFALDQGDIVTAIDAKPKTTTRLQRLTNIAAHPTVAVLADQWTEDWNQLWWVRVDGTATVSGRDGEGIAALVAKYAQYRDQPPAGPVIRMTIDRIRAWSAAV